MDRRVWIIIALIYLIWPADLLPGVPIDDIIVLLISALAQMPGMTRPVGEMQMISQPKTSFHVSGSADRQVSAAEEIN